MNEQTAQRESNTQRRGEEERTIGFHGVGNACISAPNIVSEGLLIRSKIKTHTNEDRDDERGGEQEGKQTDLVSNAPANDGASVDADTHADLSALHCARALDLRLHVQALKQQQIRLDLIELYWIGFNKEMKIYLSDAVVCVELSRQIRVVLVVHPRQSSHHHISVSNPVV